MGLLDIISDIIGCDILDGLEIIEKNIKYYENNGIWSYWVCVACVIIIDSDK